MGDGENSWSRPEVEVRKSNCSPGARANHMTRFSKPPFSSRLLPCTVAATFSGLSIIRSDNFVLN